MAQPQAAGYTIDPELYTLHPELVHVSVSLNLVTCARGSLTFVYLGYMVSTTPSYIAHGLKSYARYLLLDVCYFPR
jgi:hypothetical protein